MSYTSYDKKQKLAALTYKSPDDGELLVELFEALMNIDVNASLAQLNATSISDNNGGRIEL